MAAVGRGGIAWGRCLRWADAVAQQAMANAMTKIPFFIKFIVFMILYFLT